MDISTFRDEKVVAESRRFVALRVDMTNDEPPIAQRLNIVGLPAIVFFDSQGKELKDAHLLQKKVDAERFLETLKKVT
jgi:thiol:disulfide interchange protein DsbD